MACPAAIGTPSLPGAACGRRISVRRPGDPAGPPGCGLTYRGRQATAAGPGARGCGLHPRAFRIRNRHGPRVRSCVRAASWIMPGHRGRAARQRPPSAGGPRHPPTEEGRPSRARPSPVSPVGRYGLVAPATDSVPTTPRPGPGQGTCTVQVEVAPRRHRHMCLKRPTPLTRATGETPTRRRGHNPLSTAARSCAPVVTLSPRGPGVKGRSACHAIRSCKLP